MHKERAGSLASEPALGRGQTPLTNPAMLAEANLGIYALHDREAMEGRRSTRYAATMDGPA